MTEIKRFRKVFDRVCDDYKVRGESRAVAWDSCIQKHQFGFDLLPVPVSIYRSLDRTRTPYRPVR